MRALLKRLSRKTVPVGPEIPPVAPHNPLYVIGDLHGRVDLLNRLLEMIDADIGAADLIDPKVIFVGDFIDRGESSAAVLAQVRQLWDAFPGTVAALKGNHEEMMLKFLTDPAKYGPRWVRYGGLQTLASYGIGGLTDQSKGGALEAAAEALERALPEGMATWLEELPTLWASGNVICTHAGANPERAIDDQDEKHLIWGHPRFFETPRTDGLWIVHGHTIVDQPGVEAGRIAVDTGAYVTGRLSAVRITEDGTTFLST